MMGFLTVRHILTPMTKEDVLMMVEAGVWDCLEQVDDCDLCIFKAVCPFEEKEFTKADERRCQTCIHMRKQQLKRLKQDAPEWCTIKPFKTPDCEEWKEMR